MNPVPGVLKRSKFYASVVKHLDQLRANLTRSNRGRTKLVQAKRHSARSCTPLEGFWNASSCAHRRRFSSCVNRSCSVTSVPVPKNPKRMILGGTKNRGCGLPRNKPCRTLHSDQHRGYSQSRDGWEYSLGCAWQSRLADRTGRACAGPHRLAGR